MFLARYIEKIPHLGSLRATSDSGLLRRSYLSSALPSASSPQLQAREIPQIFSTHEHFGAKEFHSHRYQNFPFHFHFHPDPLTRPSRLLLPDHFLGLAGSFPPKPPAPPPSPPHPVLVAGWPFCWVLACWQKIYGVSVEMG